MATVGNQAEMPFLEHLEELRWRIMWSLLALAICVVASCVVLLRYDALRLLAQPILPSVPDRHLITTHPPAPSRS
jgi:sec-independent protein translocase protein TatC